MSRPNLWHDTDNGWHPHKGGGCPVNGDDIVVVQFAGGGTSKPAPARNWVWPRRGIDFDVVAYRRIEVAQ